MSAPELPPSAQLIQFISGAWVSQAIYAAAKLALADHIAGGATTVTALAQSAGVGAEPLRRVLRALESVGIFRLGDDGAVSLTPVAEYLRSDVPGSLRAVAIMYGEPWHRQAWSDITYSVQTGKPAFDHVFGEPIFQRLPKDPAMAAVFDAAMTSFTASAVDNILGAYDFSPLKKLVDVAGGHGSLLAAILKATPKLEGVLFDMPSVIDGAREKDHFGKAGVGGRSSMVGGDFFASVPAGGDAYLLKHIIHDWSDEHAVKILQSVRKAIVPQGRLLLVEMVLPASAEPHFGKWLDLEMLLMTTGGRERSEAEFRSLYERAGFRLQRVITTKSPTCILEGVPA